jgi:hypothetical protein
MKLRINYVEFEITCDECRQTTHHRMVPFGSNEELLDDCETQLTDAGWIGDTCPLCMKKYKPEYEHE